MSRRLNPSRHHRSDKRPRFHHEYSFDSGRDYDDDHFEYMSRNFRGQPSRAYIDQRILKSDRETTKQIIENFNSAPDVSLTNSMQFNDVDKNFDLSFKIIVPNAYLQNSAHVRIKFFDLDNYAVVGLNANLISIENQQANTSILTFNCKTSSLNRQIVYVYYLELANQSNLIEHLLTEKYSYRVLNERRLIHFDGIVQFETIDENDLKEFRSEYMRYLLSPSFFALKNIENNLENIYQNDLGFIQNLYDQLCKNTTEYKEAFILILIHRFAECVETLDKVQRGRTLNENEYFQALKIFLLSCKYTLNMLEQNQQFLMKIFAMLGQTDFKIQQKLRDLFTTKEFTLDVENEIYKILEFNTQKAQFVDGIHAVIVYYYMQHLNLTTTTTTNVFMLTEFERITNVYLKSNQTQSIEYLQLFKTYADKYEQLINEDALLGSIMLNYFLSRTQFSLSDCIANKLINKFPLESLYFFFGFRLIGRNDEFDKQLIDMDTVRPLVQSDFAQLKKQTAESLSDTVRYLAKFNQRYELLFSLLDYLTEKLSKEWQLIVGVIDLILESSDHMMLFNQNSQPLNLSSESLIARVKAGVKRWLKTEFNESLLVNNQVSNRSSDDVIARKKLILKYKSLVERNNAGVFADNEPSPSELRRLIQYHGLSNEYEVYTHLMNLSKRASDCVLNFTQFIVNDVYVSRLTDRLKYHNNSLVELVQFRMLFDFRKYESFAEKLEHQLNNLIIERLIQCKDHSNLTELCDCLKSKANQQLLDHYINAMLVQLWPKSNVDVYSQLRFALQWAPFVPLCKINDLHRMSDRSLPLNPDTQWSKKYTILLDAFKTTVMNIVNACETLDLVKLVSSHQPSTCSLIAYTKLDLTSTKFKQLIRVRMKEIERFEAYRSNLSRFRKFVAKFSSLFKRFAQTWVLLDQLDAMDHVDAKLKLNEICKCHLSLERLDDGIAKAYEPEVVYFNPINNEFMATIETILSIDAKYSVLFDDLFKRWTLDLADKHTGLGAYLKDIWKHSESDLRMLVTQIDTGSIRLTFLDTILHERFKGEFETMKNELAYLMGYFHTPNAIRRNEQLTLYDKFKSCHRVAVQINEIRVRLMLKDKFAELTNVLTYQTKEFDQWTLERMDDTIEQTVNILNEVAHDRAKIDCLMAFTESLEIVTWLRGNTKNLVELNHLVELVSMSSSSYNESVSSLNRTLFAKTLRDAGTAYASLIYELNVEQTGFFTFMQLCKTVCMFLQTDAQIAEKLRRLCDKVQLLDEIKRMRGHVELESLKEAKLINKLGLYRINNGFNNNNLGNLELTVPVLERTYTLNRLVELQNVLMLVSPQQDDDQQHDNRQSIDFFIGTFAAITNLSTLFKRHIDAGCLFFEHVELFVYSDITGVNVSQSHVKFNSQVVSMKLENVNSTYDLTSYLTHFFERTLLEWNSHLSAIRQRYSLFNYFTLNQITYLIKKLKVQLIDEGGKLDDYDMENVRDLLFNIDADLTGQKLREAFLKSIPEDEANMEMDDERQDLTQLWTNFLAEQSKPSRQQMSLENLRLIFDHLRANGSTAGQAVNRLIPGYLTFSHGPNLIVCERLEQLRVVFSLYGISPGERAPTNDEIVYCTCDTTGEEMENFLRLAYFDTHNGRRLYTAVNVQELNYDAVSSVERFLKQHLHNVTSKISLVFVCTDEKPSLIASLLARQRVQPILLDREDLQNYVRRLVAISAADVDSHSLRVVTSRRSGNGKSKYVKYLTKKTQDKYDYVTIRIKTCSVDLDKEVEKFLDFRRARSAKGNRKPTLFHIDIAYEVLLNLDAYLLSLAFACHLKHSKSGLVWRRRPMGEQSDVYLIEITSPRLRRNNLPIHGMLHYLPTVELRPPVEYLYHLRNADQNSTIDESSIFARVFKKEKYQRVCYYLRLVNAYRQSKTSNRADLDRKFEPEKNEPLSEEECLDALLNCTGLVEPSWHEIRNYVNFANLQLQKLENLNKLIADLPELWSLCLQLSVIMANDFGLSSLRIDDSVTGESSDGSDDPFSMERFQIREDRRWENFLRPYIVVNSDAQSISFLGIYLSREKKEFMNPNTNTPIKNDVIPSFASLIIPLLQQRVPLFKNFNDLDPEKKIITLTNILGLKSHIHAGNVRDQKYELTVDNCLKMMAIYLRLISRIPVVLMGETGCGKTRLIRFFTKLYENEYKQRVLIHVKVHGGTTAAEIAEQTQLAEELALTNWKNRPDPKPADTITCVLFFDEANTTDQVGLIKEIMCDMSVNGRPLDTEHGLKIIAAVNPYRKHTDEMIEKLENAGLGFYQSSKETKDRLWGLAGQIPMRQLVYRVQPLPTSMQPLVWDFGQLDRLVESVYVGQLVERRFGLHSLDNKDQIKRIQSLLNASQEFMRSRKDECSFVSIRDVERVITVTDWFRRKSDLIFSRMNEKSIPFVNNFSSDYHVKLDDLNRSLVLALMVCYHSCLFSNESRRVYRDTIARHYQDSIPMDVNPDWILADMLRCQLVFWDEIDMNKKNIACNMALLENVFMMIVCIELKIPLFIVGKPGSSKSLAKSIVTRAMQGFNSRSALFKQLKEPYFVNFQCSPLTTSEMIVKTFEEAREFQRREVDAEKRVTVVSLDEIGLAEASESMPLKTLHPLLESDDLVDEFSGAINERVAVIGISNWALDPAKMNRGIFVARGDPNIDELIETARGISASNKHAVFACVEPYVGQIARAYLQLCVQACESNREFFGLRDYYSLIKMIVCLCEKDQRLTWNKLEYSVRRNFGGLQIDVVEPFRSLLASQLESAASSPYEPNCDPIYLIESALHGDFIDTLPGRYLLFVTENNTAVDIIQSKLLNTVDVNANSLQIIFGSSFRLDQEYSQICRNISLIKNSMEVGRTVILLNTYNLYESLYDALNQYYEEFGGQKLVNLGLGTHRVKCSVHENFRLFIIADKNSVYDTKRFPIPLLNRLEKHFLNSSTMINAQQRHLVDKLNEWLRTFTRIRSAHVYQLPDLFVGFNSDTCASLVLYLSSRGLTESQLFDLAKSYLIKCATPDFIIRSRDQQLWQEYFVNQAHMALDELLDYHVNRQTHDHNRLLQISTHTKSSLFGLNIDQLKAKLAFDIVELCLVNAFDTQHQFIDRIKQFLARSCDRKLLLIQMELNQKYDNDLLACVRHLIVEALKEQQTQQQSNHLICLVIKIPKENVRNLTGFHFGEWWSCYHLDELESSDSNDLLLPIGDLRNRSLSDLLSHILESKNERTLKALFKRLAHNACSLIVDTDLGRTISRIELFMKLCDDVDFLRVLCQRLVLLQRQKETINENQELKVNWLTRDVAQQRQISQYSTLRRATENYIENRLAPLLAFILSLIDAYSNIDIYVQAKANRPESSWKADLWLKLFADNDLCEINYSDMRSKDSTSIELNEFVCKSELRIRRDFQVELSTRDLVRPNLPFFFHVVTHLNNLHTNVIKTYAKINDYLRIMGEFFQNSTLYQLLKQNIPVKEIIDSYASDFLLMNCHINRSNELAIARHILCSTFDDFMSLAKISHAEIIKLGFPLVHYVYDYLKVRLDIYLSFSRFEARLNEPSLAHGSYAQIHLDACIHTLQLFKLDINLSNEYFDRLFQLLQMVDEFSLIKFDYNTTNDQADSFIRNLNIIRGLYESLSVLRYLLDIFDKFNIYNFDANFKQQQQLAHLATVFNNIIKNTYLKYFNKCVDFKSTQTIHDLHSFILETFTLVNNNIDNSPDTLDKLKKGLNIFYVDVIDHLCFGDSTRPQDGCVQEILKVITDRKIQSPSGDDHSFEIELTYRSILIQIIFKNYNKIVVEHLRRWYDSLILKTSVFKSAEEISILFQNCVYDQLIKETFESTNLNEQLKKTYEIAEYFVNKVDSLRKLFGERMIMGKTFDVQNLVDVAKIKYLLSMLAKFVHDEESFRRAKELPLFEQLNKNVKALISGVDSETLSNFIIKELVRKYGSASLKFISYTAELAWITPKSVIEASQKINDRFVINGDGYTQCKEAIRECFKQRKIDPLDTVMNTYARSNNHHQLLPYLCMAFYQNVTLLHMNSQNFNANIGDLFKPMLNKPYVRSEDAQLLETLLDNSFENNFKINETNMPCIDLNMLLLQIKYSILYSKSKLLKPLKKLILEPGQMNESFLPTMPQDNLYDVKMALNDPSVNTETTRFYSCPNGHIYVIGNCGRPWIKSKCQCGEEIGGQAHTLLNNNRNIDQQVQDTTRKGYCIMDDSSKTSDIPSDMRKLNATAFQIERFIVNVCMYLACGDKNENIDDVRKMMYHHEEDLKDFFWKHLKKDLSLLGNLLNLTYDEVLILLHRVSSLFIHHENKSVGDLYSKIGRVHWEEEFYMEFLKASLDNISDELAKANNLILKDAEDNNENNQSQVYFMAYELIKQDPNKKHYLYENELFWKYRPVVSFELMRIELNKSSDACVQNKILKKFADTHFSLQLLSNLSDMVRLVKLLMNSLNKCIFKMNARQTSIEEFVESFDQFPTGYSKTQVYASIDCFQRVWSHIKSELFTYINDHISKDVTLTVPFDHQFTRETKLSYFLPTLSADGLLCYTLIHYLSHVQNEMIDFYQVNKKLKDKMNEHRSIELMDNKTHLITFDKNGDLLRIVQSNFTYDSNNVKFIFRYENIEFQIVDKYLRNKCKIDINKMFVFEYSDEISDFSVFKRLQATCKQTMLDNNHQQIHVEIMNEFEKINELSEALNFLKVIINYAITTSASGELRISQFMERIFANNASYLETAMRAMKTKISKHGQLKNLKHIWILLMTKRALLFTINEQDPFDDLNVCFKKQFTQKVNLEYESGVMNKILTTIFQIIYFVLIPLEGEDLQSYSQIKMRDLINSLSDLRALIQIDAESPQEISNYIPLNFPTLIEDNNHEVITMTNILSIWNQLCFKILS